MIPNSIMWGIIFLTIFITHILSLKKVIRHSLGEKIATTVMYGMLILDGILLEPFREKMEYGEWPHPTAYIGYGVFLLFILFCLKICYKAIDKREKHNGLKKK